VVALYTVLRAVVAMLRMAIFSTSQNKNPLTDQSKKSVELITSAVSPSSFFHGSILLGTRTADAEHSNPTYHTSVDAIWAKNVLFGSHWLGIFSLNVYARIWAQKKRIIMLGGSKCASQQDTQCAIRKSRVLGYFSGQIYTFLQKQPLMKV
jgi:hypothetical protein